MSTAHEARTRALHVFVAPGDVDADGVHDLVAPLADRLADVTLLLPADPVGLADLRRALALADAIEHATGRRPRCVDAPVPLGPALVSSLPRPGEGCIVAVPSGLRPGRLRRLRRAAALAGVHVAVLPRPEAR